jgi:hypothetical protein
MSTHSPPPVPPSSHHPKLHRCVLLTTAVISRN